MEIVEIKWKTNWPDNFFFFCIYSGIIIMELSLYSFQYTVLVYIRIYGFLNFKCIFKMMAKITTESVAIWILCKFSKLADLNKNIYAFRHFEFLEYDAVLPIYSIWSEISSGKIENMGRDTKIIKNKKGT
jgi:hypothetical protein